MRKLMWFTIGFGASCSVGAYLISGDALVSLGVAALILCLFAFVILRNHQKLRPLALIFLGVAVGFFWYWGFDGGYLSPTAELDGVTTEASIEITDYSFETTYGIGADGIASWQGKSYRVRVYLSDGFTLSPGDIVSGTFRFRITDDGGAEEATFHRGSGITLLAYQSGEAMLTEVDAPWWEYPAAFIRHKLVSVIQNTFPEDTQAFARALLLGDDTDLDYETNTAFQVSGIRHIIAVSGLHVSILFGFIYMISGKHRVMTAVLGIPVLILFAAVAGFTPSVTRACIMHGLMIFAMLFEREYDPPTALSFAALVMLLVNPLVITSVSFQLSVGCMAGIFLFAADIKNWLLDDKRLGSAKGKSLKARLKRGFAGSVSVSLGAVSITTPLAALHFGSVSLISPLTNLLTLWVVTIVFYGIMAVCALGLFWTKAASALAWLVSWPIRYILEITKLLAQIPMAAVYTQSEWIIVWLCGCYVLLAVFLIRKRKRPLVFACIALLGLCCAMFASWIPPMLDDFRITVLDVGQGQSVILQSDGKTFVVDCGGDFADDAADITAETLLSMGISRIDGLILTHYDADHAGGAEYLLSRIQADSLYLPCWEDEDSLAIRLAEYDGGTVYMVDEDFALNFDDTQITVFTSEVLDSSNESSLCVLFQTADCDILITGDRGTLGENLLLRRAELPELEVLVVGHHGSKNSTSEKLLAVTSPKIAVISVGENNSYGHPAEETLDRLEQAGCIVYRTDRDGTVIIRR